MDLGWDNELTAEERAVIDGIAGPKTNWKTDLSGGIQRVAIAHECAPFGNRQGLVQLCGLSRIQYRSIVNRSTPIVEIWLKTIQRMRTGSFIVFQPCMLRSKNRTFRRTTQWF